MASTIVATDPQMLRNLINILSCDAPTDRIYFDTESDGPRLVGKKMLNVHRSSLTGFSLHLRGNTYYVPVGHYTGNAPTHLAYRLLRAICDTQAEVWAHNWKHDAAVLRREGLRPPRNARDSMIMMWLLEAEAPGKSKYGLKAAAKHFLDMDMESFEQVTDGGSFASVDPRGAAHYAGDDVIAVAELVDKFRQELWDKELWGVFKDQEMPMVFVLSEMEHRGFGVDCEELAGLGGELRIKAEEIHDEWNFLFPDVLITSSSQVSDYFYGGGLWPTKGLSRGKSGRYTVNADAMRQAHAFCKEGSLGKLAASLRLDYQYISKNLNTYTHTLVDQAFQHEDGRLRCSFMQHGTRTGRLSCSNPNLQNIPARSDIGKNIRAAFRAPPGRKLVVADYSQIELRVLAHLSKEGKLLDAYSDGADVHQQTADLVGCSRQQAKTINFATVYGAAAKKLGQQLGVSKYEAQRFLDNYNEAYPEVDRLRQQVLRAAYDRGYVKTLSGRRRNIPQLTEAARRNPDTESFEQKLDRWHGERLAFNTPVQGGAADLVKKAMIAFSRHCDKYTHMVSQVHDEILVECDAADAEAVSYQLQKTMEEVFRLRAPLIAEPSIAQDWGSAK